MKKKEIKPDGNTKLINTLRERVSEKWGGEINRVREIIEKIDFDELLDKNNYFYNQSLFKILHNAELKTKRHKLNPGGGEFFGQILNICFENGYNPLFDTYVVFDDKLTLNLSVSESEMLADYVKNYNFTNEMGDSYTHFSLRTYYPSIPSLKHAKNDAKLLNHAGDNLFHAMFYEVLQYEDISQYNDLYKNMESDFYEGAKLLEDMGVSLTQKNKKGLSPIDLLRKELEKHQNDRIASFVFEFFKQAESKISLQSLDSEINKPKIAGIRRKI